MSKQLKAFVLSVSVIIVIFIVVGGFGVHASSSDGAYRQLSVYTEVLQRIRTEYVEEPNFQAVTMGALHGLLESLDANSSYLTPAEYKQLKDHHTDGKGWIGATVSKRFGYAAVVSVLPNGPAEKAGLQTGDILESIESRSSREMSLAQIHTYLYGQPGSTVNFSVVRPGKAEPQKIAVQREAVNLPAVSDKVMEDNIGYLQPFTLAKGKSGELANDVKQLQKQGAKKLLLDLRNVAEGDPQEGVAVANLFLNHGTITYLQGQKYPRENFAADPQKAITNLPVVVLVNRGTSGAAEIVAAAILENARGDVVGDKTFGSGSVQKTIDIPDGSALILSVAKYYSPGGKSIEDAAVTPNILVASSDDDVALPDDEDGAAAPAPEPKQPKTPQNDEQLKRAITVLKSHA
jgi:carboxyl-terminal processing protease